MAQQAADAAAAAAALASYQRATQALRDRLTAFVTALWRSLGEYRQPQMAQFVAQVVPVVTGAQQQMSALTAAYLAAQRQAVTGVALPPVAVDPGKVTGAAVRNGTDPADVYGRPFHLVWRQLADLPREPGSIEQAIQSGLDRAVESAVTDVQLAKTHTARAVMAADPNVVGYRRVLEGAYSCALCVVASTLRYHKSDLLPIHPQCDCAVQPVIGDHDPGPLLDEQRLADAHAAIKDQFGRSSAGAREIPGAKGTQYRDVLVTHDHGELGPVLAVRNRPFTGPSDIGKHDAKYETDLHRAQAENQRRAEGLMATLRASVEANRTT